MTSFFSSGKIILSGEHSVVYGEPALVSAIDLGISACASYEEKFQQQSGYLGEICSIFKRRFVKSSCLDFDFLVSTNPINTNNLAINIESNLPRKSGLGSSAAFANAVFLCLLGYFNIKLSKEEIFKLVLEAEKYIHGTSSGVDPSAIVFGGTQIFKVGRQINLSSSSDANRTIFERKNLKNNLKLKFTLISSGEAVETTGEMVSFVRSRAESDDKKEKDFSAKIIKKMGEVTTNLIKSIASSDEFNYSLISENQRLLEDLGVVGKKAKNLVKEIEALGGFAKITGAGGVKQGSGWLLAFHPYQKKLEKFVENNNLESYKILVK